MAQTDKIKALKIHSLLCLQSVYLHAMVNYSNKWYTYLLLERALTWNTRAKML